MIKQNQITLYTDSGYLQVFVHQRYFSVTPRYDKSYCKDIILYHYLYYLSQKGCISFYKLMFIGFRHDTIKIIHQPLHYSYYILRFSVEILCVQLKSMSLYTHKPLIYFCAWFECGPHKHSAAKNHSTSAADALATTLRRRRFTSIYNVYIYIRVQCL